ncbi:MAG: hypothetical protein KGL44_03345 [Sphingomonadales bacterium]|nr:hypothetical protein [Sphingomonadales bacterium]
MTLLPRVAACNWREPGGADAAVRIVRFLEQIGVGVEIAPVEGPLFVPGMEVRGGKIRIDPDAAGFPGDLLHEAGHIAVADPARRAAMTDVGDNPGEEMAAIAWSVAAARACDVPLAVVFHPEGYRGASESHIANFEKGAPFGVPLLGCWGMSCEPIRASERGEAPFPAMKKWLR